MHHKHNKMRKRKFTRQNRKLIYKALREGLSISTTVDLVGLHRSTYYRWIARGQDNHYPMHKRFRERVIQIQAQLHKDKLEIIRKVAKGGYKAREQTVIKYARGKTIVEKIITKQPCWQAAAWYLERRFPETYRKKSPKIDKIANEENKKLVKKAFDALMENRTP